MKQGGGCEQEEERGSTRGAHRERGRRGKAHKGEQARHENRNREGEWSRGRKGAKRDWSREMTQKGEQGKGDESCKMGNKEEMAVERKS